MERPRRIHFSLNRDAEAINCFDKAIALQPDHAGAHHNKSFVKLALGQYEEGWKLYEWRWKTKKALISPRLFSQPLWLGEEDMAGKTVLIHSEQGLGDTIHFYRYLADMQKTGCNLIFEAPAALVPLIATQRGKFTLVGKGAPLPDFDLQCPLMSLPLIFKTTVETIPASIPYFVPAPAKSKAWRAKLGEKTKPRIGIVWSGNPKFANDIRRSMPLKTLLPVLGDGVEWHALQKDIRPEDREALETHGNILEHGAELNDFADTAALIGELDLVVSVDTAVAHLAGAMGKPVWILLPFHPDFRWLRDREDRPWYPTARLIRATKDGDWSSVIERLAQELGAGAPRIAQSAPPRTTPQDIDTKVEQAIALQQRGQLAEAKRIYQQVLAAEPRQFDARCICSVSWKSRAATPRRARS